MPGTREEGRYKLVLVFYTFFLSFFFAFDLLLEGASQWIISH